LNYELILFSEALIATGIALYGLKMGVSSFKIFKGGRYLQILFCSLTVSLFSVAGAMYIGVIYPVTRVSTYLIPVIIADACFIIIIWSVVMYRKTLRRIFK